jgi:hypothetical protein
MESVQLSNHPLIQDQICSSPGSCTNQRDDEEEVGLSTKRAFVVSVKAAVAISGVESPEVQIQQSAYKISSVSFGFHS